MSQKRVIVAQPAALSRDGAGLLQVGVVRWTLPPRKVIAFGVKLTYAAEPMMTFAVKATFSYAGCASPEDEMELCAEPEGMSLDVPSELPGAAEDEIACSSDFVPLKRLCDVLVTGHAFARRPVKLLRAAIALGPMARSFTVASEEPATRAPLVRSAIRGPDGEGTAEPVGPGLTPALLEPHPFGFDFAAYNTAPPSQRLEEIPHRAKLSLTGLSERAEALSLRLPSARPVLWVETADVVGRELPLACDTVWIDTDRELCVMVYRTQLLIPTLERDGVAQVTLALARGGVTPLFEEVRRGLDRGVFEAAVELSDFDEDAGPPPEPSLFAKYAHWAKPVEPTISLERYAVIAAALAEGSGPRHETLRAHGMDEDGFLLEERGWLTRMSEAALKGDTSLAARYGDLFVAAQDRLAGPGEGGETLMEYAKLKVDVEDAGDPTKVLEARKMTLAAWMRMDRRWTRRAIEDRAVEIEVNRQCAAYRAREGGPAGRLSQGGGGGQLQGASSGQSQGGSEEASPRGRRGEEG